MKAYTRNKEIVILFLKKKRDTNGTTEFMPTAVLIKQKMTSKLEDYIFSLCNRTNVIK